MRRKIGDIAMLLRDLVESADAESIHAESDIDISGISYDSRNVKSGDLFFAVRGFQSDGHSFAGEAAEKGAVCIICEEPPEAAVPYVIVPDSRRALALASAKWFGDPAAKLTVIGVTGTNGKTTVTNLIKQILEKATGEKVGLIGTNRNMIGGRELHAERTTPESYETQELLAMMAAEGCRYAVMEVSSHALLLDRVYGIGFEVGVFTNLSPDHLDFHASIEDYAEAKSRLFAVSQRSAVNIDDAYAQKMIGAAAGQVFTYAVKNDSANLVAKSITLHADRVEFCALMPGKLNRVELRIPGIISVYNAMSAISAALMLGLDIEAIAPVLSECEGVKGRAEIVPVDRDFSVLIDYAHTPDALRNIITTVQGYAQGRVVTLFGCGGDRDSTKRPVMGAIAAQLSDFVVVTSDNPRTEEPGAIIDAILSGMKGTQTPYEVIENRREAIRWALENARAGDVLILAGKGHETYQILGKEKRHFDEREVVAEYVNGALGDN